MSALTITFDDKVLYKDSSLPANEKWQYTDANEVKEVVNAHASDIDSLQEQIDDAVSKAYSDSNSFYLSDGTISEARIIDIDSAVATGSYLFIRAYEENGEVGSQFSMTEQALLYSVQAPGDNGENLYFRTYNNYTYADATALNYMQASADGSVTLGQLTLSGGSTTARTTFALNKTSTVMTDGISSKGIVYGADYSANGLLDDRWIPDLGGVKSYVTGLSIGAFSDVTISSIADNDLLQYNSTSGVWENTSLTEVSPAALQTYHYSASSSETAPTLGQAYYTAWRPELTRTIDTLTLRCSTYTADVTINVTLYNSSGTEISSGSTTVTSSGYTSITLDSSHTTTTGTEYFIGLSITSSVSVFFLSNTTNSGQTISKTETIADPYDLPTTIGTTSAGVDAFWFEIS